MSKITFTYVACISSCISGTEQLIFLKFSLWQGQR